MKEKECGSLKEVSITLDDFLLLEGFYEVMMRVLVEEIGEDVLRYVEMDKKLCVSLFVLGSLYGQENWGFSRLDIIERTEELRKMSGEVVGQISDESLLLFNRHKDVFIQIMLQGIYFGQKSIWAEVGI